MGIEWGESAVMHAVMWTPQPHSVCLPMPPLCPSAAICIQMKFPMRTHLQHIASLGRVGYEARRQVGVPAPLCVTVTAKELDESTTVRPVRGAAAAACM